MWLAIRNMASVAGVVGSHGGDSRMLPTSTTPWAGSMRIKLAQPAARPVATGMMARKTLPDANCFSSMVWRRSTASVNGPSNSQVHNSSCPWMACQRAAVWLAASSGSKVTKRPLRVIGDGDGAGFQLRGDEGGGGIDG